MILAAPEMRAISEARMVTDASPLSSFPAGLTLHRSSTHRITLPESVLRCPGCGAPAATDSAACEYCGSALATVTCPSCFAPMFMGSRFCARCGAEATRAVVDEETPLSCPRCGEGMQSLRLGGTSVHECAACGGLWIDPASLQRLCDAREEHSAVANALAARIPTATAPDVVRYVPCPRCAKLMNRVNFSKSSGVIMDVCKTDGVWLDRGELQRVIDFVEHGGLTLAREREREHLQDEQRRLAAMEAGRQPIPAEVTIHTSRSWTSGSTPDTAVGRLLFDALGLFIS